MKAIFKREIRAYFTGPLGYIVLFFYALVYGILFYYFFSSGVPLVTGIVSSAYMLTLFVIPVLTMRLFSEEKKQKTDQALLTAPVKLTRIVMGKFLAAFTVFMMPQLLTIVFQFIFSFFVTVDWVNYFCGMLGTVLFACMLISIGILISSLTENQLVSALCSLGVSLLILMLDSFANMLPLEFLKTIASWASVVDRYESFISGIFDYSNTLFFISFTALFLFLTVRVQEKRRWS